MASAQLIQWSDKRCIGVPELDEQHRAVVNMLNDLHLAIVGRNGREISSQILDRLDEYPARHFSREEDLMQRARYSGFETHREEHEDFMRHVADLRDRIEAGGSKITFELLHFLKAWLAQHIHESDRRFGAFVVTTDHVRSPAGRSGESGSPAEPPRGWWQSWMES